MQDLTSKSSTSQHVSAHTSKSNTSQHVSAHSLIQVNQIQVQISEQASNSIQVNI